MRSAPAFLVAFSAASLAAAAGEPVSFKLQNHVPVGRKPTLTVIAARRVGRLSWTLEREEGGPKLSGSHAGLAAGQSLTVTLGDGAPGRSHWKGALTVELPGHGNWNDDVTLETIVQPDLKVGYRLEKLDLDRHVLEFQLSRPGKTVELSVIGEDGTPLGDGFAELHAEAPGTWLPVRWEQKPGRVLQLRLKITDVDDFAVESVLTPWSLSIEHREVNFRTASADLDDAERPKLDEAYARIAEAAERVKRFVHCRLFIAGHTDTVGPKESNQKLSIDRARAIAIYFKKKGLSLPISYEGFGESRPKVQTPDETDEPRNRRVDYVLTGREAPPSPGDWKEAK